MRQSALEGMFRTEIAASNRCRTGTASCPTLDLPQEKSVNIKNRGTRRTFPLCSTTGLRCCPTRCRLIRLSQNVVALRNPSRRRKSPCSAATRRKLSQTYSSIHVPENFFIRASRTGSPSHLVLRGAFIACRDRTRDCVGLDGPSPDPPRAAPLGKAGHEGRPDPGALAGDRSGARCRSKRKECLQVAGRGRRHHTGRHQSHLLHQPHPTA